MMIKYRVREVAKDLDIPNKDVIDTLAKYFPEPKKYMTALTEEELDVVFEAFTQEHSVKSLDDYFAQREQPAAQPAPKGEAPRQDGPQQGNKGEKKPQAPQQQKQQGSRPEKEQPAAQAAPKASKPAESVVEEPRQQPTRRVVDTRSSNVNIDKYNEKYDQLADQKVKTRTDNVVTKQKFPNRNNQRRGQRRGKRETEAERLRPDRPGAPGQAHDHRGARRDHRGRVRPAAEGPRHRGHQEADEPGRVRGHQRHHRL